MPGGRPPKPTAILALNGGLRKGRHDEREREPQPEGDAFCVGELDEEAQRCWEWVQPRLIQLGLATELDSHELTAMCQWWSKFQQFRALDDVNKMATAYKSFRTIAAKFGLTPTDRVGLQGARPNSQDELADLIA
jgi:phage terminase small subunit